MIPLYQWPSPQAEEKITAKAAEDEALWARVSEIVTGVRERGDEALLQYTRAFDGCTLQKEDLRVKKQELESSRDKVSPAFLAALRRSKDKIERFHLLQKPRDWFAQDETGSLVGQTYRPLRRVGIYVPGGTANYPSSVLMTCLPAKIAGVQEIVMVTPPRPDGSVSPATLAAAAEAGVSEIYRIGGAQAIAALAYGTQSIARVDKIAGPGNIFVTLAKKMVFGVVGIDMLAGPSEILIIGDGSVKPAFAAADLLSQAEHDGRARAILLTPDAGWAGEVIMCLNKQLEALPRASVARAALADYGAVIVVKDLDEAVSVANRIAPEHLELLVADPWLYLPKIEHAGAVFLGAYSPEAVGDYWAGPSHVLPTGGAARYASPLSVEDFLKRSSIINYTKEGLLEAGQDIASLTGVEKLSGHGSAVTVRLKEEQA